MTECQLVELYCAEPKIQQVLMGRELARLQNCVNQLAATKYQSQASLLIFMPHPLVFVKGSETVEMDNMMHQYIYSKKQV